MTVAIVVAWLLTTVWVGIDAARREWSAPVKPDGVRSPSLDRPWKWIIASLFLWPIVFPTYVYRRVNVPLKG